MQFAIEDQVLMNQHATGFVLLPPSKTAQHAMRPRMQQRKRLAFVSAAGLRHEPG